jgi:general secretion pathway protein M
MIPDNAIVRQLTTSRLVAVAACSALLILSLMTIWVSVASTLELRRTTADAADLLDQLNGRRGRGAASVAGPVRAGSPFLEGPTVTVAGASLLQRVASAITEVGGNIQSSQVDVQGVQAKEGFVGLLVSCEVEQAALQKLLYDLEAGMPFMFVDQLDVQMPQAAAANQSTVQPRVRVMLGVSAQWQPAK